MEPRGPDPALRHEGSLNGGVAEASERMRQAIIAATEGRAAHDGFQAAARELVAEWRRQRVPPEQILLRIKEILAAAGLRPTYATPNEPIPADPAHPDMYRDVFAWTIRHYFDSDGSA